MATATLAASQRTTKGKGAARTLRRSGQIPAVIYGHAREPQSLAIGERELDRLLLHISAASTVIELMLDGRPTRTLIREIQRHPIRRQVLHVDFQELVAGERVSLNLPVVLLGVPDGVRHAGGILDHIMHEIRVEVDPADIPGRIDVDVTDLAIGHSIHVSDLQLPAGVKVLEDANATVCVVSILRIVEEPVAAAVVATETEAVAEPELIRKPKPEDEEEEGDKKDKKEKK
jgi:large subunit ribosomal protein L25